MLSSGTTGPAPTVTRSPKEPLNSVSAAAPLLTNTNTNAGNAAATSAGGPTHVVVGSGSPAVAVTAGNGGGGGAAATGGGVFLSSPLGAHSRTTSASAFPQHSRNGSAGLFHSRNASMTSGVGLAFSPHGRTASTIGAQNMCNLFVNFNPNLVAPERKASSFIGGSAVGGSAAAAGGAAAAAAGGGGGAAVSMGADPNNSVSITGLIDPAISAAASRSGLHTLLESGIGYVSKKEKECAEEYIAALENIHKTYLLGIEGVPALRGVNVEIQKGEFMVIFGTSGGGKSTLLNILGTIDVPTKGNLMLFDSRITDRTPDGDLARIRCHHIGFVFQSFNLLSTMTAVENVSLPMIIAGTLTRKEIKERAEMLLTLVGLGHRMDHFPSMLSGGEQQRVTIARSLANEPDMLLMDEPTGDLDTKNTHLILSILLNLNREKRLTMVMVTHDVYMKPYADRILYLRDGRVANIETVPPHVSERAYEELLAKVDQDRMFVGEHVEQTDGDGYVCKSVVRTRADYETKNAMRKVNHSAMDSDMRAAVEMLFGRSKTAVDDKKQPARADDGVAA